MTQKFTTPCFIRKNTEELRKKLEKLGYKPTGIIFDEKLCIATAVNGEYGMFTNITSDMFDTNNPYRTWNCAGRIDCGADEDLFLALVALRENSEYMQWFTDGEFWGVNFRDDIPFCEQVGSNDFHKATVEEIIECFKD